MALAQPESAPKPLALLPTTNGEALAAVLSQAITEAQRPLLGQLQGVNRELQTEIAALRQDADRREHGSLPALETRQVEPDPKQFGPLVRLAVWLETRLRGR